MHRSGAVAKFRLRCTRCKATWEWRNLGETAQDSKRANSQLTGAVLFTGMLPSKAERWVTYHRAREVVLVRSSRAWDDRFLLVLQVYARQQNLVPQSHHFLHQSVCEARKSGGQALDGRADSKPRRGAAAWPNLHRRRCEVTFSVITNGKAKKSHHLVIASQSAQKNYIKFQ